MSVSHTPGPWYLINIGDDLCISQKPNGEDKDLIADLQWKGPSPAETNETYANGNVLAAAPELLEACKEALAKMTAHGMLKQDNYLSHVIARAEGR